MLRSSDTALLIIDVQDKLARVMHNRDALIENLQKAVKGARALDIPVLWIEQNPRGLGPTVPEVADLLVGMQPISNMSFRCCRNTEFMQALEALDRKQVLAAGIEAHVCVYQTAVGLVKSGFEVEVLTDAVSSRTPENKEAGLRKMRDGGVGLTSIEIALFELLEVAEGKRFKEILKIVK